MHLMHSPSVEFGAAAASTPTAMCKVRLSVWRLVKMSGLTGQHRALSQHLTNLHSSFYRAGVEPEIHATFPNTAHTRTHKHWAGHSRRHRLKYAIHVWPWCCSNNGRKANWWAKLLASDRLPQRVIPTKLSTMIRRKSQRPFHRKNPISSFSIDSIWTTLSVFAKSGELSEATKLNSNSWLMHRLTQSERYDFLADASLALSCSILALCMELLQSSCSK